MSYSVLMTVYKGEKASNLDVAIQSMLKQTIVTDDFVIVCDGELTTDLDMIIEKYVKMHPGVFNVFRFPKRDNWAAVLNDGLAMCKNELVARMDSDDISLETRCEKQLMWMAKNPDAAVISVGIAEFGNDDPSCILSNRILPTKSQGLAHFAKYRCPLNHATVIYKKSAVLEVGGYENFSQYEDYQLWMKMIKKGYVIDNIQEPLYLMRAGDDLYRRRGGKKYFENMKCFKRWMKDQGFLSIFEYAYLLAANGLVVLMPSSFRKWVYCCFLRK